jgi:aarF domain-containing kinase
MALKILARMFVVWWIFGKYFFRWLFIKRRRAQLMRQAFEDLGPTYIKLGQIIASSPGLFPDEYSTEFKKCLDQVRPFDFADVQKIVAAEIGKPFETVFKSVDPEPIAAASIAQVHGATLKDGTDVVIKVQRPKIRKRVDADLWFIRKGAWLAERFFVDARLANVTGMVDDFSQTIYEELDFTVEGRNMDQFNEIMKRHKNDSTVVAPIVYWETTTTRLLTMERFYGIKADDVTQAREKGIDTEVWLRRGMRAWNMTMMLHGFFHGDVHAGNLMFMPERDQIGYIDFGIVGRFDDGQRMNVLSFSTQDYMELGRVMVEMGSAPEDVDLEALAIDMERVYKPLLETSIGELEYGRILPDLIRNSRKHQIRIPREFILILKQLLYFDRYAKLAAPNLNVFSDVYLVDFLFTPSAAECGIDMQQISSLLMSVQQAMAKQPQPG